MAPQGGGAAGLGLFYGPSKRLFTELKGGQLRVLSAKETLATRAWKAAPTQLKIINRANRAQFFDFVYRAR